MLTLQSYITFFIVFQVQAPKMQFITALSVFFLALPATLAAPTAKADNNAPTSSPNRHFFKRDCLQQNESGYKQAPTVPDSDVQGLINTINGMGGWDTLVPLPQWGGTFRVEYGSAMLCITNNYMFCNTHLSMGEASWVANWIAYDQCNLGGNPNNL